MKPGGMMSKESMGEHWPFVQKKLHLFDGCIVRPGGQEPIDNHLQNSGNIEIEPAQTLGIILIATYWYEKIAPSRIILLSGQHARTYFSCLDNYLPTSYNNNMLHVGRILKTC